LLLPILCLSLYWWLEIALPSGFLLQNKTGLSDSWSKWKLVVTTVACCWPFLVRPKLCGYWCTLLTVSVCTRVLLSESWSFSYIRTETIQVLSYIHSDLVHYSIIRAYIVAFELKDLRIDASSSCVHALIFSNGSDRSD
jgi:hypothetical protein